MLKWWCAWLHSARSKKPMTVTVWGCELPYCNKIQNTVIKKKKKLDICLFFTCAGQFNISFLFRLWMALLRSRKYTVCSVNIFDLYKMKGSVFVFYFFSLRTRGRYSTPLSELQHFDKTPFLKSFPEYFLGGNNSMFQSVLTRKG